MEGTPKADPGEILIPREEIQTQVARIGRELSADYAGVVPVLVAVLKGAIFFLADLAKHLDIPCEFDFMAISRYRERGRSGGVVRITRDVGIELTGRHVVLVEDIIDTGLTVAYLRKVLLTRDPASVEICALLNRTARRIAAVDIKYAGMELPDVFVVGYGLDDEGMYRNLQDIRRLAGRRREAPSFST